MKIIFKGDSMSQYLLAIDQGTTSSRSIIFSSSGKIEAVAQQEFSQKYPKDGWVEHEPEEIWESVLFTLKDVFKKCSLAPSDIASIGITNQRRPPNDLLGPLRLGAPRDLFCACQTKSNGLSQRTLRG